MRGSYSLDAASGNARGELKMDKQSETKREIQDYERSEKSLYGIKEKTSEHTGKMTVKELSQLYWLNREIELDQQRLARLDAEITKDEEQLAWLEIDASSPASPNYSGIPKAPSHSNKIENAVIRIAELQDAINQKKALRSDCAMTIQAKQILCLTERNKLERYIAELPDSLLRMIFTYRFVNGFTWYQVSEHIGMKTTEDSVKKMCYRYIAEQNKNEK